MEGEGSVLGEGINGPVRKAVSRDDGRKAAVKTISTVNLSEQRKQMVVSELRIFLQARNAPANLESCTAEDAFACQICGILLLCFYFLSLHSGLPLSNTSKLELLERQSGKFNRR